VGKVAWDARVDSVLSLGFDLIYTTR
jgi:hypothetical protein